MHTVKMAEPIEMQFGMLSRVGPGIMHYMGGALLVVFG